MVTVPRCWPGETVVCLGTGPSLTPEDVAYVRDKARVIAVNDAYRLAPWADALYACDVQWWKWHHGVPSFTGPKWSLDWKRTWSEKARQRFADVRLLTPTGLHGLETAPSGLRTGGNSGYQAINLAVHYGASRIVLLGYDMKVGVTGAHFFGEHPSRHRGPYATFVPHFATLVAPLRALGIEIVNCSRQTALKCFPRDMLGEVLRDVALVEVAG